ncbi:MAG: HD-GYP domain-containing protein [Eubacteriales bacterium]
MYGNKLFESMTIRSSLISAIKATMFEKSHETEEHAERMVQLTKSIGQQLGLTEDLLNQLRLLAILHDIGKLSIGNHILTKKDKLNDSEWLEIKKHPESGYRIASASPELKPIADYILCHHERWDGDGYPQGLMGESIPLLSRIIAVADTYDAMINDRSYRKAKSKTYAVEEIKRASGKQFDPVVVDAFLKTI